MAARANFAATVRLGAAHWAAFFPLLLHRLFRFRFGNFRGTQANDPGFVGLLNRALGMDAAQRVRRLTTDGTEMFWRRRDNDDRFFATHNAPNVQFVGSCAASVWDAGSSRTVTHGTKTGRDDK